MASRSADTNEMMTLSNKETAVLDVFRMYLMSPGKMLCFTTPQLKSFKKPLALLTDKGLLVEEDFSGGYSLTENGFVAMKECE